MSKIAIIAALDRELAPLVGNWQVRVFSHNGQNFRAYERGDVVAVAGGIGVNAARTMARALVAQYHPQVLVSAGVAGATRDDLAVATVITPQIVVDAATGKEYRCELGSGTLVTTAEIADSKLKHALAERFHASAVDMEAASVAEVAQQEHIGFRCIKAISDQAGFVMPPLNQFVDEKGQFRTAKFALWAILHPRSWPGIITLARNTGRASKALCDCLKDMADHTVEPQPREMPGKTTKVLDI